MVVTSAGAILAAACARHAFVLGIRKLMRVLAVQADKMVDTQVLLPSLRMSAENEFQTYTTVGNLYTTF